MKEMGGGQCLSHGLAPSLRGPLSPLAEITLKINAIYSN